MPGPAPVPTVYVGSPLARRSSENCAHKSSLDATPLFSQKNRFCHGEATQRCGGNTSDNVAQRLEGLSEPEQWR
eukprot:4699456-Amphidinium_carterae.2